MNVRASRSPFAGSWCAPSPRGRRRTRARSHGTTASVHPVLAVVALLLCSLRDVDAWVLPSAGPFVQLARGRPLRQRLCTAAAREGSDPRRGRTVAPRLASESATAPSSTSSSKATGAPRERPSSRRRPSASPPVSSSNNGTFIIRTTTSPQRRRKNQSSFSKWDRMVKLLEEFRTRHGHSLVTNECVRRMQQQHHHQQQDYQELLAWTKSVRHNYRHQVVELQKQRAAEGGNDEEEEEEGEKDGASESDSAEGLRGRRRPRLSSEKLQQLFDLDFVWDAQACAWEAKYRELLQFQQAHGHCRVPNNSLEFPGLGVWVRNQRRERKKLMTQQQQQQQEVSGALSTNEGFPHGLECGASATKSTLTPDRLRRLEALEFDWYKSHDDTWNDKYRQLQEYVDMFGHSNVKQDDPHHFVLGQWCMNQRVAYRKQQQRHRERTHNIDNPLCATPDRDATATATATATLEEGIGVDDEDDDHGSGALTRTRIQRLERLGFSWHVRDDHWQAMKQRLVEYYHQNGHINIPTPSASQGKERTLEERNVELLRTWLNRQRHEYKRWRDGLPSPMTMDRARDLEHSISHFSWQIRGLPGSGPSTEDWAKLFDAMRAKGLRPGMRPKSHWFEGSHPFRPMSDQGGSAAALAATKDVWTAEDLLALWNQESEPDDEESDLESDTRIA